MKSKIQLGPWVLDPESGELTQLEQKIILPRQQHQLLMALVSAGRDTLVSRENIIAALWPDGRVVEFDQSLNASMRKLRRALNDNSDNPVFIETVTGKGYRLIVEPVTLDTNKTFISNRLMALVVLIMLFVIYLVYWPRGPMQKVSPVLAVMPVTTVPADNPDPLAHSLREELLNQFSRASTQDLIILAPGSMSSSDPSKKPTAAIYLYTSISQDPINKRIHLRLVNRAEKQIWSESFDWLKGGGTRSYQSIATEVTQSIAQTLKIVIPQSSKPMQVLTEERLADFNHGLYLVESGQPTDLRKAVGKFQRVLDDHPDFVPAIAKLAHLYTKLVSIEPSKRLEHFKQAQEYAQRALSLEHNSTQAWVALAYVQLYHSWSFTLAKTSLEKAIAISPNDAQARSLYAAWYASQADAKSSIEQARMAKRIDPGSMTVNADLCWYLNFAKQFEQAEAECSLMLTLQPSSTWMRLGLVEAYAQKANWTQATRHLKMVLGGQNGSEQDQQVNYTEGDLQSLYQQWLSKLEPAYEMGKIDAYFLATLQAAAGNTQQSIDWLQTALRDGNGFMVFANVDPRFDSLRARDEFQSILQNIKPNQ
ncbi:MAG: hypothetical protein Alis3KO_06900 [Aliiglaciecola sp.]